MNYNAVNKRLREIAALRARIEHRVRLSGGLWRVGARPSRCEKYEIVRPIMMMRKSGKTTRTILI